MDDNGKYRELFLEESDEYLQVLNDGVLMLEKDYDDKDALNNVFRSAHTLKGMSATMGYDSMAKLTHGMESALELFKSDDAQVGPDVISAIFKCLDILSEMVEKIRSEDYSDTEITDILDELSLIIEESNSGHDKEFGEASALEMDEKIIKEATKTGFNAYRISIKIDQGSILKGARAYLVVNKLEQQGDIMSSSPSAEDLEAGNFNNDFELFYISTVSRDDISQMLGEISELEEISIEPVSLDKQLKKQKDTNKKEKTSKQDGSGSAKRRKVESSIGHSIRVDIDKLDSFMDLVSELVIYRNQLEDINEGLEIKKFNEPLSNVTRISNELQDLVLKIRMQPVGIVFNRFPRMVRDLAKELNKKIEFIMEGEDTELDKTVVSEIGEPLIHLIRNAIDHGIEIPKDRKSSNKEETGKVKLSAYQEGNRVIITLSDDGKGLDPEVIKESAIKKGLNVDGLDEAELKQLIFNPGFSTAQEVTDISGRGVGMDVVKQKINSLGGSIDVLSNVGVGTSFVIKLPLTLSIIQSLLIKVSTETYAVPLGFIKKVIKICPDEIHESSKKEIYMYEKKAIPIIRLNKKLGTNQSDNGEHLIIVHVEDRYHGLVVDDLLGQQEIVIKKLSGMLGNSKDYLGATILGNGEITLILDIGNLCR